MNLRNVERALRNLNPHGGLNPYYNCTACAVITAKFLIGGVAGTYSAGRPIDVSRCNPVITITPTVFSPATANQGHAVLAWLQSPLAPQGVYVFDGGDHVWNIVKDPNLYILDSNAQNYRQFNTHHEATMFLHTTDSDSSTGELDYWCEDTINYNYLWPPEQEEDIDIYYWGRLHHRWQ